MSGDSELTDAAPSMQRSSTMRWIAIADMRVSPFAQRDYRPTLTARIASAFDLEAFGYPVVSYRGGHYYIVDGQHRIAAAKLVGFGEEKVECEYFDGLSEEEEAELFLQRDQRQAIRAYDKYRISITAGREAEVEIDSVVQAVGLTVASNRSDGSIAAVATLKKIYKRSGGDVLKRTLSVVYASLGQAGLDGDTIDGMSLVFLRYGEDIDDDEIINTLSKMPGGAGGLAGKADQLQRATRSPKTHCIAASIVDAVNIHRSRSNKLTPWWRTRR